MTGEESSAEKLVKSAKKTGVKLLVGFIERFNPGVRAVKKMLSQQAVGDVIIATGRRVARWPIRIGDVGVVKDTAIHDIDAMRYLLQEEVSAVFAQTGSLRTHSYEDYAEIMLRFRGGTTGFLDANWLTPRKVRTLIITGSDATISLDYIKQEITEGLLSCTECNRWYPISDEIPQMLPDDLREAKDDLAWLQKWKERVPDSVIHSGKPFHLQ